MLVVPLKQGGLGIANTVTSVCNVGLLAFALRKKLGKLEMESLRKTFLPLAVAGVLAGLLAWVGWQLWESQIGHATIALKIGAVFVPAGIAGSGLLAGGAGVQNSGGEGNDGICAGEIQKDVAASRQSAANMRIQWRRSADAPLRSHRHRRRPAVLAELRFEFLRQLFRRRQHFPTMANVVEPLPDMSAASAPFSRKNSW